MQRLFLALSIVASAAVGVLAADLKIDVTTAVECERKTQAGDTIDVHYKGTLENGKKFDASAFSCRPISNATNHTNVTVQAMTAALPSPSSLVLDRSSRG